MKRFISFTLCALFFSAFIYGQADILTKIDSIRYLGNEALNCNSVIWRIVAQKDVAIPGLIDLIADSAVTSMEYECKTNDPMKVGDIAFYVLDHIVSIPITEVTSRQFDLFNSNGCQAWVYQYIDDNRLTCQKQVSKWYFENKSKLVWQEYEQKYLTECRRENNISGYYRMPYGKEKAKHVGASKVKVHK